MNTKVIVCCHKKDVCVNSSLYLPLHVGKALHPDVNLGIQTDDIGDNISIKNASYCELTGMYWAWKNLKGVDVIGLCHYRRYFDFHNQCKPYIPYTVVPSKQFDSLDLSIPDSVITEVASGKVFVTQPKNFRNTNFADYCIHHISDDFRKLEKIINTTQPEHIRKSFFKIMYQSNELIHYNMFIMKWNDFDTYCNWLFPLLQKCEEQIDISHYTQEQARIFGYFAERLFNVWLYASNKDLVYNKCIWVSDHDEPLMHYRPWVYQVRCLINNIGNWLLKPRY